MKVTRRNSKTKLNLARATVIAAATTMAAAGGSFAYADNTLTSKEAKQSGLSDRYIDARTELYHMSVNDFLQHDVVNAEGKPVGSIDKVVTDTRENRGEAIIALNDGGKISVPLGQLHIMNDKVALPSRMDHQYEIQAAAEEFKKETVNDQYREITASDEYVGKHVYTGNKGFIDLPEGES